RLVGVVAFFFMEVALAQRPVTVGVVYDGEQYQFAQVGEIFKRELLDLTSGEFAVDFVEYRGNWTRASINQALDQAYGNPQIDMVLAMGFATNQIVVGRENFPKPTFLPLVFDTELTGAPTDSESNGSGKTNLNYLTGRVPVEEELVTYQRIVAFDHAAVFIDELVLQSIPGLTEALAELGTPLGFSISIVEHDGTRHDLAKDVPENADVVLYTGLPRMPTEDIDRLIEDLTDQGIPTFSLSERSLVERGMLAADTVDTDWTRLGRRNALNMQSVMLGEPAARQSIYFAGKQELTINMKTARRLGLSPRFDVLSEATLLNTEPAPSGPSLNLRNVAEMAITANLDLQGESLNIDAADQDVRLADSGLLPQLSLSASQLTRKASQSVSAGLFPERSTDGSLSLSQTIYSDDVYANRDISRNNRNAVVSNFEVTQLDVINEASQAYIDVLRAQNQLNIQQQDLELTKSNLDLARDRVRLGASTNADVYRWQSNLATTRSQVLLARAALQQAREALNRVLHRPITDPFSLEAAGIDDPFVMTTDDFDRLVNNPRSFNWLTDFAVTYGLENAPELQAINEQIMAQSRDITNQRRDYWLPDLELSGQLSDNLNQSGLGAGGLGDGQSDWTVSISASLPVYTGGARKSQLNRSEIQLRQLRVQRAALAERIEQQIRAAMHAINANYANIELSKTAAESAKLNLDLITDAYAKGTLSILDLLDAQSQSLDARLSADNAVYDFLSSALNMHRATSRFDFLLSTEDKARVFKEFEDFLNAKEAELTNGR
ncbi:MAG: TolC family protein, partial [Pseudomonadota bacterium]